MLDEHVYVDDDVSGAEFANRLGFPAASLSQIVPWLRQIDGLRAA